MRFAILASLSARVQTGGVAERLKAAVLKFATSRPTLCPQVAFRICKFTRRAILCHLLTGLLTKFVSKMLANAETLNI